MRQGKRPRRERDEDGFDDEPVSENFDTLVDDFRLDLRNLHRSFHRAVTLEWLRFRARLLDAGVQGVLHFFVVAFFLAIFLSGGVFIALAIRDALGNLVAGFTILGVVLLG